MGILLLLETFSKCIFLFHCVNGRGKKVTSSILKGTKCSYNRQNVVILGKAFNYNQMLGYMKKIQGKANQISIYIRSAQWQ